MAARNLPVYTTGTISGTSGTATVSGSGTLWTTTDSSGNQVNNVVAGDWLVLPGGQGAIPIKSVNSATSITLEYNLPATISAGTSYRIIKYAPVVAGTLAALLTRIEAMGSSSSPDTSRYIDDGAARMVFRIVSGVPTISVGAASAADGSLVNSISIDKTSGYVGVGTNSPGTRFHAYTAGAYDVRVRAENGLQAIDVGVDGSGNGFVAGTGAYPVLFYANGAERMRIGSSGPVGIGTAGDAVNALLHVKGAGYLNGVKVESTGTGQFDAATVWIKGGAAVNRSTVLQHLNLNAGATQAQFQIASFGASDAYIETLGYYNYVDKAWGFLTDNTERMHIDSIGNVGYGTTAPAAKIHLKGTTAYGPAMLIDNAAADTTGPYILLRKGRSSGGAAVQVSDDIGSIQFRGFDSSGVEQVGSYFSGSVAGVSSGAVSVNMYYSAATHSFAGTVLPALDNSYSLGLSGVRFSVVYAATGTINTSDARQKTDIAPMPSVLEFVERLNPVMFKYKVGGIEIEKEDVEEEVEVPETETVEVERVEMEVVDGKAVRKVIVEEHEFPVFDEFPVYDEDGNQVFNIVPAVEEEVRVEAGEPIVVRPGSPEKREPVMHRVRRMKKITRTVQKAKQVERPGRRVHLGLLAQEVAAIAKDIGIDAAIYTYDPESDHHGLRYDQFIAPLIKGEQELIAENKSLRALVNDLSARVAALEAAQ